MTENLVPAEVLLAEQDITENPVPAEVLFVKPDIEALTAWIKELPSNNKDAEKKKVQSTASAQRTFVNISKD